MGLLDQQTVAIKLRVLKAMGHPDAQIAALKGRIAETLLAQPAIAAAAGGAGAPVAFDAARLAHQLFPKPKGPSAFVKTGIDGGHITAPLLDFAAQHPKIFVFEASNRAGGGATWRRYEQYYWNGVGNKPAIAPGQRPAAAAIPPPAAPGAAPVLPTDWLKSGIDKTTCDDVTAYLTAAEAAYRAVMADLNANTVVDGNQRKFGIDGTPPVAGNGVEFGGWLQLNGDVVTMFPFAGWIP
jgi:hypothetical protein